MYAIRNYFDNKNIIATEEKGAFRIVEYVMDLSVTPSTAETAYFMARMNVRKRQLLCDLSRSSVTLQAGAMQWMIGDVNATTGIKGVGDFIGKAFSGKVTGESAIKPEYVGKGIVACEPTYKHLFLLDMREWGGSVVLDDGMFMACESTIKTKAVMRTNASSAIAGGKGLFSLGLMGTGIACVESNIPRNELIELEIRDDVVKIDGPMAIAWSGSLQFTVERSGKTLLGSAASGEGLVNCYRGTGKILMAPVS